MTSAELGAALARFEGLYPEQIDLSLGRIEAVLAVLGDPQRHLPPVIHVAGTNGKGSTCAFLRAMAEAAGLSVHVAISPHLVRFNERIRLAGKLISDAELIGYLDEVHAGVAKTSDGQITHFEATIAAAMLSFARTPADLIIIETGLGGRFDATNIVPKPAMSVITPIDFDHAAFLGTDLSRIAWEKAGIIKHGCPVASAIQSDVAAGMIAEEAFAKAAPLHILTQEHIAQLPGEPALAGDHQYANAALAALALEALEEFDIPRSAIASGLQSVNWPARLQRLEDGPLTRLAGGKPVWLDGGHNPHAARAIAQFLSGLEGETVLITGMMARKDIAGFLTPLAKHVRAIFTCPIASSPNGVPSEDLAEIAGDLGFVASAEASLEAAIRKAGGGSAHRILVCGSLYLAGELLAQNEQVPASQDK